MLLTSVPFHITMLPPIMTFHSSTPSPFSERIIPWGSHTAVAGCCGRLQEEPASVLIPCDSSDTHTTVKVC